MKSFFRSWKATLAYVVVALVVAGFVAYSKHPSVALVDIGATAQDWTLKSPDGSPVAFYEVRDNQPSVLIFWATWCGFCQELMPELDELEDELPPGTANFYALNVFEDGDPVGYFQDRGYGFELLLEADAIAEKYGVIATPGIIVVDVDNTVIYARWGNGPPGEIADQLKELLL